MVYNSFHVLLNSICQYFVEEFCIYTHQGYWPVIFFSCSVFSGFGTKTMLALYNEFGSIPSSSIFQASWRTGINFSFSVCWNSRVKPSDPGLLFAGRFFITDSISNWPVQIFQFFVIQSFFFFKCDLYYLSFFKIFIYLVALGLSCGRQTPQLRHLGSLVVACELLVATCMWDLVS